jgi:hypothetical protein
MQIGMARGRWDLVKGVSADDEEWLSAAGAYANALDGQGEYQGAAALARKVSRVLSSEVLL